LEFLRPAGRRGALIPTIRDIDATTLADWQARGLMKPEAPAPPQIDTDQAEKDFQADVVRFAKRCGWEDVYHTWNSKRSSPGFPDVVFGRTSRVPFIVVAELKVGNNEPTEDQRRWLEYFRLAGVPTFVWRPADWPMIEKALR
jgi:hypothetical protein